MVIARRVPAYGKRITVDPKILVGKPLVRGTRVPVELVLKHLAENLDVDDVIQAFPRLTIEDIRACVAYAQALVEGEDVVPLAPGRKPRRAGR